MSERTGKWFFSGFYRLFVSITIQRFASLILQSLQRWHWWEIVSFRVPWTPQMVRDNVAAPNGQTAGHDLPAEYKVKASPYVRCPQIQGGTLLKCLKWWVVFWRFLETEKRKPNSTCQREHQFAYLLYKSRPCASLGLSPGGNSERTEEKSSVNAHTVVC